jgi:hypothetical protein
MKEAIRIYALAPELSTDPKRILLLCEKWGFGVRNSLSTLTPEQRLLIETLVARDDPGGEASPGLAPIWRPPPRRQAAVRLKPDSDPGLGGKRSTPH